MSLQRSLATTTRLPNWMGSVRFRLTLIYSLMLFGLAAIVVGAIYLGVANSVSGQPVTRRQEVVQAVPTRAGVVIGVSEREEIDALAFFEKQVNRTTLENLRTYSFSALALLFVGSLGVGWFVAGRVLAPIDRITQVAEDIQATDLQRRIGLDGPDDELKHLADTFDDMIGRLDVAFESQRQFIHEASHELRNPLAVIRTNLDVTLSDDDVTTGELRETADVVGRAAERMSTLVDDLLLYARHERPELGNAPVDVSHLVQLIESDFAAVAEARSIDLVADVEADVWVSGDQVALQRAVANLVANAVRLAPEGSTVTVAARTEGFGDDRRALISVSDEGPGIAESEQKLVFQRFWRSATNGNASRGRSGLGLTIVRQIVEAHGGAIGLDSELGVGSTFTVSLGATTPEDFGPPPSGAGVAPVARVDRSNDPNGLRPRALRLTPLSTGVGIFGTCKPDHTLNRSGITRKPPKGTPLSQIPRITKPVTPNRTARSGSLLRESVPLKVVLPPMMLSMGLQVPKPIRRCSCRIEVAGGLRHSPFWRVAHSLPAVSSSVGPPPMMHRRQAGERSRWRRRRCRHPRRSSVDPANRSPTWLPPWRPQSSRSRPAPAWARGSCTTPKA